MIDGARRDRFAVDHDRAPGRRVFENAVATAAGAIETS